MYCENRKTNEYDERRNAPDYSRNGRTKKKNLFLSAEAAQTSLLVSSNASGKSLNVFDFWRF